MLVLGRKKNERILIGDDVILTVVECRNNSVRLGFTARPGIPIDREEIAIRKAQSLANARRESSSDGRQ